MPKNRPQIVNVPKVNYIAVRGKGNPNEEGGAFEEGIIPVLCVVTMSLAMSAAMEYTESLLAPILMHFIWNYVGTLIFNVVTLADDYPHYFNSVFSDHKVLTGGSCFIEGSIVVLVINLVMISIFIFMLRKKHKSADGSVL